MYVCHTPSNRFFFISRWNRAIFRPSVLRVVLYKMLFFDFWFRPPNPQNVLPKIRHKIAYKSACMAYRPEIFGPTTGFRGWPMQWNHAKCCGPTLVAIATTFALGAESNRLPACVVYELTVINGVWACEAWPRWVLINHAAWRRQGRCVRQRKTHGMCFITYDRNDAFVCQLCHVFFVNKASCNGYVQAVK